MRVSGYVVAVAAAAACAVGLYNTLAEAIHARDVAILAVHGYDTDIAATLAPAESYSDTEVVACRVQVGLCGLLCLLWRSVNVDSHLVAAGGSSSCVRM